MVPDPLNRLGVGISRLLKGVLLDWLTGVLDGLGDASQSPIGLVHACPNGLLPECVVKVQEGPTHWVESQFCAPLIFS